MSFIPYSCQNISDDDVAAVCEVLRSEYLTQGPVVPRFEEQFAARHAVAHAVAVSNATAGLHIGALALGVGPGTRVWTSPNSFVASANCALYCGAQIDFVDIDPGTRQMSVSALADKLAGAQRSGTSPHVVIPVDFAGLPCELREIRELADRYGFKILQDASHATGASYLGQPVGSRYAHASVFSFHAVKIVTTAEGGIVTTHDPEIARKLRLLRSHGVSREAVNLEHESEGAWYYEQSVLGFNYRMTEVQAALGLSQLARLPQMQAERSRLAHLYYDLLADLPLILPARRSDRESAWHLYVVEIDDARTSATRARVFDRLRAAGIGVNVHYIPIHIQPYYARLGFRRGDFPASERYYARAMSIPLFPALTSQQQVSVAQALKEALA